MPIQTASLGMADSLILMVLALVVFGPRRLPQIGRQIGKLMYEFRKASNDFKFQMEEELRNAEEADRRKREEAERQRALAETQTAVTEAKNAAEEARSAAAEAQSAVQAAQLATWASESAYPEPASSENAPTETGLRVQPPSTGEQVAADRPNRTASTETKTPESASDAATPAPDPFSDIESATQDHISTESTANHG